jgi:excinuclease ABC subunit A
MDKIIVKGAREHNLKNIDVEIPRNELVVITGLSGSGKSSLAFDTIYAEGQRRYVESLSAYARQFLEQMAKPDLDSIEGLSPAISIEQRGASRNPRSTVGTITEIHDYLRLLYARIGKPHCVQCGKPITAQTVQQIVDKVLEYPSGMRFSVLAPIVQGRKGEYKKELAELRKLGFVRVSIDGDVHDLSEDISLDKNRAHTIEVYVDRLVVKDPKELRPRLTDSVEMCLKLAQGLCKVSPLDGEDQLFSARFACVDCGFSYPEITPRLFSFNNPHGACPACGGLGALYHFDPDLCIPDPELSIKDGAIAPWERRAQGQYAQLLDALSQSQGQDPTMLSVPWAKLPESTQDLILHGSSGEGGGPKFEGVLPNLERRMKEYERRKREEAGAGAARLSADGYDAAYEEFQPFMSQKPCGECEGTRLRKEARFVRVGGKGLPEVAGLSIRDCHQFFAKLELEGRDRAIGARILREVSERMGFLVHVGLEYLSLDRTAATLSGGEAQRIRLATQIGSSLVGVLYILDEPSIGLHQRDNDRLIAALKRLRDLGNSVLVVEHDEDTIRQADYVIDMGPAAGIGGGRIVAAGTPDDIIYSTGSLTGAYLSGRKRIPVPTSRRTSSNKWITLKGARANNLKDVTLRIPTGVFTAVTGVSGSGKSTLIIDTLLKALQQKLLRGKTPQGEFEELSGTHHIDRVIDIDQSAIGRTPRSNPATYTGVFTHIRDLFAQLPDSKVRGYKAGRYSFNVKGGRCESCQGDGILRIEMHFLPDIFVECEVCRGRRYNRETLEVKYKGRSISDVLDMTVNQACDFLQHVPKLRQKLETLRDVGLGYLTLGQSATTLSGGEAQRIKLSKELAKKATGRTLYILDEPTTGLHFADIHQLLDVLNRLVDAGNTVVVIEHNLDVIKTADYVVDMGPEGGDRGGQIVASGVPEDIARTPGSFTGQYLKKVL